MRAHIENQSFTREERIRKRNDFITVYRTGVRIATRHFVVYVCKNQLGSRRLGVSIGKKIGNAVKRNRIKRLLREFFRLNKDILPDSHDFVIVATRDASSLHYRVICEELRQGLEGYAS